MSGVILPDGKPETLKRYNESLFAPTKPVKEREPEDRRDDEQAR
ncbi:MAG TPA: hypothetical protein VIJ09_11790 [Acidimicrobiales bacterium]